MSILVLLRHGESEWNLENRFTGWKNINLSEKGILEAKEAGKRIKDSKINIDKVYSSELKRANDTAEISMKEAQYHHLFKNNKLLMIKNVALNERDYGNLTGLNKKETAEKFGKEQVQIWRRSFDVNPPGGESLKDVLLRVKPYYEEVIKNDLEKNTNVLLSAHGNSLRALFIVLNIYSKKDIAKAEIPTGKPYFIEFENNNILNNYYL